jgi:hypothetical protein
VLSDIPMLIFESWIILVNFRHLVVDDIDVKDLGVKSQSLGNLGKVRHVVLCFHH